MNGDHPRDLVEVCGRREKTIHRVSTVDCATRWSVTPGDQQLRVDLMFSLGELSPRWSYVALFARVEVDDRRVVASALSVQGGEALNATVGMGEGTFGWFIGAFGEGPPLARMANVSAALHVPADVREVGIEVRLDLSMAGSSVLRLLPRRLRHARSDPPWRFQAPVDATPPPQLGTLAPPARLPIAPSSVRLCVAVDIENYSRFRTLEAMRAQERLLDIVSRAQANTGVAMNAVKIQSSGDGLFVVLPSGVDETFVIPVLVHGLVDSLASVNADLDEHARLRIRVAMHRGAMRPSPNGWVGSAAIAIHRLLDAPPLRAVLRATQHADLALIVPDMLFRDIIAYGCGGLTPAEFQSAVVDLPNKTFTEHAWVYAPARKGAQRHRRSGWPDR